MKSVIEIEKDIKQTKYIIRVNGEAIVHFKTLYMANEVAMAILHGLRAAGITSVTLKVKDR